jgi:hypothetical protein
MNYLPRWKRANWCTSSGKPVANQSAWVDLNYVWEKYISLGGTITHKWVKGHSGNYGNDQADKNADLGRKKILDNDLTHQRTIGDLMCSLEQLSGVTATRKVNKANHAKLNPLLNGKRWFFMSNTEHLRADGKLFYLTTTYKTDKKLGFKNVAKSSADTHYSIILTKNPIPVLDSLRMLFNEKQKDENVPVIVELQNLCKPKIWEHVSEHMHRDTIVDGNIATHIDSTLLATIVNPPLLLYKLSSIFDYGFSLMQEYLIDHPTLLKVDITDFFFTTDEKGKRTITSNYSQQTRLLSIPDIKITCNVETTIKLIPGVDTFARSGLLALVKSKEPVKIILGIMEVFSKSYRLVTFVEHGDDFVIYFTPDSNFRLITEI